MDKAMFEHLSSPPETLPNDLPVTTTYSVLPFERLAWETFEKFCFQLGCKDMNCIDTSYIYGRKGQKQDGIDIYFQNNTEKVVWQIKRYAEFKSSDVSSAVNEFLKGKWHDKTDVFALCVSNYLDDVGVVDEIAKQFDTLKSHGVTFAVLNSEKLTEKAKHYPELINDFFGKHWSEALGISKTTGSVDGRLSYWQTDYGKKLDSEKIYHHGDFDLKFEEKKIYIDERLPDGATLHAVLYPETGAVQMPKFPYPLNEYKIEIPDNLILRSEEGYTIISGNRYYATIFHLKWGKKAILIFDEIDHKKLLDIHIETKTSIDNTNKIIYVIDPASCATEL